MTRDGSQVEKSKFVKKAVREGERRIEKVGKEIVPWRGRIERRSSLLDAGQLTNRGKAVIWPASFLKGFEKITFKLASHRNP